MLFPGAATNQLLAAMDPPGRALSCITVARCHLRALLGCSGVWNEQGGLPVFSRLSAPPPGLWPAPHAGFFSLCLWGAFYFVVGPHLVVLRTCSCFCTRESLLTLLRGPYVVPGSEPRPATCRARKPCCRISGSSCHPVLVELRASPGLALSGLCGHDLF